MITTQGLQKLGFTPEVDFILQDDGQGVYIREWMSASPQPTEAEIEVAHAEWEAEAIAQAEAKEALRTSVINKIAATFTPEEKAWLEENL